MIIRHYDRDREVFFHYMADGGGKVQRHFGIIPEDGYPGFIVDVESECQVLDEADDHMIPVKCELTAYSEVMMHPVLANDLSLYSGGIEDGPNTIERFLAELEEWRARQD